MADEVALDIGDDTYDDIMSESARAHSALMLESRGNAQNNNFIVRSMGGRHFGQADPIEAAAVEMIMNPRV